MWSFLFKSIIHKCDLINKEKYIKLFVYLVVYNLLEMNEVDWYQYISDSITNTHVTCLSFIFLIEVLPFLKEVGPVKLDGESFCIQPHFIICIFCIDFTKMYTWF